MKKDFLMRKARISKIPEKWDISTIDKSCLIENHLRKPISLEERNTIKGEYPYYGPTGILSYINKFNAEGKYVLIGEDGDHFLKYNSWLQTIIIEGRFNVNNHAHIIASTNQCCVEWFNYFFQHRNITNFLTRQGAGRFKLNKETLKKLPILLPPIEEQRKIAEILSTWDKAIALTEKLIEAQQKLKKGLRQKLLTGNFRFSKYQNQEWKLVTLKQCSIFVKDGTHGTHKRIERGIPLLSAVNISDNGKIIIDSNTSYISEEEYKKIHAKYELNPNDLLVTVVGTLGRTALVQKGYPKFTLQRSVAIIRFLNLILPSFAYHYFGTTEFQHELIRRANITAQPGVYLKELEKIKVPLVSVEEQLKIYSILDETEKSITKISFFLESIKKQKRGLMQKLLTGECRVNTEKVSEETKT